MSDIKQPALSEEDKLWAEQCKKEIDACLQSVIDLPYYHSNTINAIFTGTRDYCKKQTFCKPDLFLHMMRFAYHKLFDKDAKTDNETRNLLEQIDRYLK